MATAQIFPFEIPRNEKENYFRMHLLLEHATDVLRDVLRTQLKAAYPGLFDPSKTDKLFDVLDNLQVKHTLLLLKNRKVINSSQMKLLYPSGTPSTTVTTQDLDITLAVVLLRNITNLNPHAKWENPPASDTSIEANIGRVKTYRNQLSHGHRLGLTDTSFQTEFNALKHVLLSLSPIYTSDHYDKLLIMPLEAKVAPCQLLSLQLPGKFADLKGREDMVQQIQQHIAGETRLVLLTGMGGIGKTSVAIEVGHREQKVLFIDMRQVTNLESVKLSLVQHYHPTSSLKDLYSDYQNVFIQSLSSLTSDTVIIFDNNDEVMKSNLQEFHKLIQDILNSTKHITLLCTSREAFSQMSHYMAVIDLPPLDKAPSIDILWEGKTSRPTDSESVVLSEIAEKCGGNPLALKLLSVQLKKKTAQRVLDRIKNKNVIESLKVANLPASQEMMACLDMSYETLNTEEKRVFRALHMFPVSFSLEEVSEMFKIDEDKCESILDSLSNKSLLSSDLSSFDLHPLLRAYAEFQARKDQNEIAHIQDAYCKYYMKQTPLLLSEFDTLPSKETYAKAQKILPHLRLIAGLLSDQLSNNKPSDTDIFINLFHIACVFQNLFLYPEAFSILNSLKTLIQKDPFRSFDGLVHMFIGNVLYGMGKYKDAYNFYQRGVIKLTKILGSSHPEMASVYSNMGNFLMEMGKYTESISYMQKCLEVQQENLGSNHPEIADTYSGIADTLRSIGKYTEALSNQKKCIEILEGVLGPKHPKTAMKYDAHGTILKEMGRFREAFTFHQKSIDVLESSFGSKNIYTASAYSNIGEVYRLMGKYREALKYNKKSLSVFEEIHGPKHPRTAKIYINLGNTLSEMGKNPDALAYYKKSHAILKDVLGPRHIETVKTITNMCLILKETGKPEDALKYYSENLDIMTELMGPKHPETSAIYHGIGGCFLDMGIYEVAVACYHKCLEGREEVLGPNHPNTANTYSRMGLALAYMGKNREALTYHNKCLGAREIVLGFKHPDTVSEYSNKGHALSELGEHAEALKYYEKALDVRREILGDKHPDTALLYRNIGCVLHDMGKYSEALTYYEKCLEVYHEHFGPDHEMTVTLNIKVHFIKLIILSKVLVNMSKYLATELIVKGKFNQASRFLNFIDWKFKLYKF
ncbi:uncharacterized protein LOC106175059 [Lingula anatina]|uniref:Uncharacterized protein LOC106175059 n=1 Tax=Lingula anatina TaxID=7574 RepID=A0A1S3JPN7_LINAN|nr:uncharacterized protein LOC106175059 [Lingula anatina]|eukprot:XP_013412328.1 uncharacterized protein LOC106175059 [Lingula anatina]